MVAAPFTHERPTAAVTTPCTTRGPGSIRRLLDIVVTDGLSLETSIAKLRALISTAVAATNLLKAGDFEARLAALEAVGRRPEEAETIGDLG